LGGRPTGPRDAAGLDVETLNALQALSRTGSVVHVDMDHGTPDAPKPHPGPSPPRGGGAGGWCPCSTACLPARQSPSPPSLVVPTELRLCPSEFKLAGFGPAWGFGPQPQSGHVPPE